MILLLFLGYSLSIFAQEEVKEGVMTMKVTMSSENEQVSASLAMIGDLTATTHFKDDKSRTEMSSPMTGTNINIVDNTAKTMLVLMENPMLGKKFLKSEIKTPDEENLDISVTENGETKTILDYECKGYDIVVKKDGMETKMTMFVTDKIKAPNQNSASFADKIDGFPLLAIVSVNQQGMPITTTAEVTEIKIESVDDSLFDLTVPEGYTELKKP